MKNSKKGQSLFEVVMALGLITLVIISVVAITGVSIKNSSFSKNKTLATRESEATFEWLRQERDLGWNNFFANAQIVKWCFTELSWGQAKVGSCASDDYVTDTLLKREINFNIIDALNIEVTTQVYWVDAGGYHEVSLVTTFTNWKNE